MTRFRLSLTTPTVLAVAALSLSSAACGAKGDDDDIAQDNMPSCSGGSGGTSSGTGGSGATGGSGGSAGSGVTTMVMYPFTADEEGWKLEYVAHGTLANGNAATDVDIAAEDVKWSTGKGDGDGAGALEVDIPYTSEAQYVGVGINLSGIDLSDKKITARVKLDSGLGDPTDLMSNPGGAKLYAKSGTDYVYVAGGFQNIDTVGKWYTLTLDLKNPSSWSYVDTSKASMFDPTTIGELGIQFDTGAMTTTAMPAVELVDNISW